MTRIMIMIAAAVFPVAVGLAQEPGAPLPDLVAADDASGLTVVFPREVRTVERFDVSMSEKTDGRDRFPRFVATTPDGIRLEASLVPYPPASSATNPHARLTELAATMVGAVGGTLRRREFAWLGGFPALDAAFTSREPDARSFRVRLVLYPRDVLVVQAIGAGEDLLRTPRFDRLFGGITRAGVKPPPSFLHRAPRFSLRYAPGARLTPLDDGMLIETDDGAVYIRAETPAETGDPLADLASLLGEVVGREGPVELRSGPRRVGAARRRCASMTLAAKCGVASAEERIVRYYSHSGGRLLVTATRRLDGIGDVASGVRLVISSFEVTEPAGTGKAAEANDDD